MPQKSTEDSLYDLVNYIRQKIEAKKIVVVISLDIEGAFDNAWWPAIRVRLAEEKCPINIRRVLDSYLRDRKVTVRYGGEQYTKSTSKGCVQGSIGGPILWNLLLDSLIKGLESRGDYCQAFADDVVLVFHGNTALEIERQANAALAYVQDWGADNKLSFGPTKTKAMVMTRKLKYDVPRLRMGGVEIGMSHDIKILGLYVDNKLTFNKHVSEVCKKAIKIYKQISRAARVSWGLHPEIVRIIYTATIEPVIMYASSVWATATQKIGVQKQLNNVQRGFAQKLTRAYRTVSLNSSLILSGLLPLDIRIREAAALYEAKKGVPRADLGGREVERVVAHGKTPHPAEHMNLEFICLTNQEQLDCHNLQSIRIYTDGSKIDGKVGAALSLWNSEAETKTVKLKLSPYCTVYQAELLAICEATRIILDRREGSFGIYSDSKSALETISNNDSKHHLAVQSRSNIKASILQNKEISLFWIKAHAGLEGNERADALAKDAAKKMKTIPNYDQCPVSFVKRQIRKESLEEWNRRYMAGETAGITKVFFPDAVRAYEIVRKIEPT
ncbi:jg22693, partial [Pararge aegeria aegeria]